MKLHEQAVAKALAVVAAVYYLICTVLVYVAPDLYKSIAVGWAHGIDVDQVWRGSPPEFGAMIWGFVTFTLASWFTGYFLARVYNYFLKAK